MAVFTGILDPGVEVLAGQGRKRSQEDAGPGVGRLRIRRPGAEEGMVCRLEALRGEQPGAGRVWVWRRTEIWAGGERVRENLRRGQRER